MKKPYLIMVCVLVLSSVIYPQGKSSFQFSGGIVYPLSSSPGLAGTLQYHYNINTKFNFCISDNYATWDKLYLNYSNNNGTRWGDKWGYSESYYKLSKIMVERRYIITQSAHFKLFVNAGIG